MSWTLGDLAQRFGLAVVGDPQRMVEGVCALESGKPRCLSYCADHRLLPLAAQSKAEAVIAAEAITGYGGTVLLAREPLLAFARIAALFDDAYATSSGRHQTAVVDDAAQVAASAWIGPHAVIEAGAIVGERCFVGPNCVVRHDVRLGDDCRLESGVYVGPRCGFGARVHVLPGAVIGGRGFGNVFGDKGWEEVPQLGAVRIGDDVEIGANTTIDRGTIDDTVIEDGVRLDNQIQIAHNCRIGRQTAIAGAAGVAGSTRIGARCMIGGAANISGHLEIGDDVVILGRAMVTKSLPKPGLYGSGLPAMPARDWRRLVARLRRLELLEQRLRKMEKILTKALPARGDENEQKPTEPV